MTQSDRSGVGTREPKEATKRRPRMRACAWAAVGLTVALLASLVIAAFVIRELQQGQQPPVDRDALRADLPRLSRPLTPIAQDVLATRRTDQDRCAARTSMTTPAPPPVSGVRTIWCELGPRTGTEIEADEVDKSRLCPSGSVTIVFIFDQPKQGSDGLAYNPSCTPRSWFDMDPMSGLTFLPLDSNWYAVQRTH